MTVLELPWLPRPPDDFRRLCKAAADLRNGGEAFLSLARSALDLNQLTILSRALQTAVLEGRDLRPLDPLHVAILADGTADILAETLAASAARHGIALRLTVAPYNQVAQQAMDPRSLTNSCGADVVLLALNHQGRLRHHGELGVEADEEQIIESTSGEIAEIRAGLVRGGRATVLFETIPPPSQPLFGGIDRRVPGTPERVFTAVNRSILELAERHGDCVLDKAGLAALVGLDRWYDARQWHLSKLPCSPQVIPLYSDHVGRVLGALRGKSAKCLVLDLDNTLWGGVIGDDGVAGIVLGQGDPVGEAHLAFQRGAMQLKRRGVVLAVCSKNNESTALLPFREHPEMVIRETDVAVFVANWNDKASNLESIAATLNIGVDSLVMADDNPAERHQIRQALPSVRVLELPADPSEYADILAHCGYFESVAFSREDTQRAEQYRQNARRTVLKAGTRNLDEYLRSLNMVLRYGPFDDVGRARITQLINKSNQYNLTTRRYSEAEVLALQNDPTAFTLQARLEDSFGDNGMITIAIACAASWKQAKAWSIDTWLMSCRVLGRGVEQAMLNLMVEAAAKAGATSLLGRFIPTPKNSLVRDHYEKLGFEKLEDGKEGSLWHLRVADFQPRPHFCSLFAIAGSSDLSSTRRARHVLSTLVTPET